MDRAQKAEVVKELNGLFVSNEVVVFAHYAGMTVAELTSLRLELAKAGAGVKVVKNRLARLALEGTDGASSESLLTGPTAIAYSVDPTAAPKAMSEFAKKNEKLVLRGGFMGATILDVAGVNQLASLPSLDELRGKIVGLLQAPASKIASILQAPGSQVARAIGAYATKDAA